ncbi:MAG: PEGA domain-containing protein [Deltaproteobacteria bacterium]|nr:MAG: PEGA domain-containing protein [Deltaproteobacteria bacterium]
MTRNPTRIGRYDLITALATGGMGRIWLARAAGMGGFERKVVIKTLEVPVTTEADQAVAMFLDEARLLGLLHHQHIASVFEVGRDDDGRHYMVVDFMEGASAHDVWERAVQCGAALPLDFTLTVTSAVANALHYAHTRRDTDGTPLGIVHRDVTPSNVMIGHDGAVQLIDFGIAMAANRKTKTQTGFVKGKVGYLSPEQVTGRDVDPRTDVFALGILLYELSTMHRAFRDSSDLATMQRIKSGRVTRPSLVVPNYPLELEIIVMKALQVDPRERFADADGLRRAIEALGHRLHLVLGDAAVIEVMAQLFEQGGARGDAGPASRASDPSFEWADSDNDLTVRRDPDELLAVLRAENKVAPPRAREARDAVKTASELPTVRPRKLRAATEAADALIVQTADAPAMPLPAPETPTGVTQPGGGNPPVVVKLVDAPAVARRTSGKMAAANPPNSPSVASAANAANARKAPKTPKVPNAMIGAGVVQARAGRLRLRWIAAMALVVAAAPVAYYLTRDSSDAVAGATSPPTEPGPPIVAPMPTPGSAPVAPDPPSAPSKVRVRITTRPADATVLLDNKRLGHTPLDETVAADPGKHVIKLRRKGYAIHRLDITLDADVTEDIPLTPQK